MGDVKLKVPSAAVVGGVEMLAKDPIETTVMSPSDMPAVQIRGSIDVADDDDGSIDEAAMACHPELPDAAEASCVVANVAAAASAAAVDATVDDDVDDPFAEDASIVGGSGGGEAGHKTTLASAVCVMDADNLERLLDSDGSRVMACNEVERQTWSVPLPEMLLAGRLVRSWGGVEFTGCSEGGCGDDNIHGDIRRATEQQRGDAEHHSEGAVEDSGCDDSNEISGRSTPKFGAAAGGGGAAKEEVLVGLSSAAAAATARVSRVAESPPTEITEEEDENIKFDSNVTSSTASSRWRVADSSRGLPNGRGGCHSGSRGKEKRRAALDFSESVREETLQRSLSSSFSSSSSSSRWCCGHSSSGGCSGGGGGTMESPRALLSSLPLHHSAAAKSVVSTSELSSQPLSSPLPPMPSPLPSSVDTYVVSSSGDAGGRLSSHGSAATAQPPPADTMSRAKADETAAVPRLDCRVVMPLRAILQSVNRDVAAPPSAYRTQRAAVDSNSTRELPSSRSVAKQPRTATPCPKDHTPCPKDHTSAPTAAAHRGEECGLISAAGDWSTSQRSSAAKYSSISSISSAAAVLGAKSSITSTIVEPTCTSFSTSTTAAPSQSSPTSSTAPFLNSRHNSLSTCTTTAPPLLDNVAGVFAGGSPLTARPYLPVVPPHLKLLPVLDPEADASPLFGKLEKFSPSIGRGWQTRYFELQEKSGQLVYWEVCAEEEALYRGDVPRGVIKLSEVSRLYADTGLTIVVHVPGRDYKLRFSNPKHKDAWLDVLDVATYNARVLMRQKEAETRRDSFYGAAAGSSYGSGSGITDHSVSPLLHSYPGSGATSGSLCGSMSGEGFGRAAVKQPTAELQRQSTADLWSSFVENWVMRPMKLANSKSERASFTVQELELKKNFLKAKGLLKPLRHAWMAQQATASGIVDMRRYVPNLPDEDADSVTQYLEGCGAMAAAPEAATRAKRLTSILNMCTEDLLPRGLPNRYRLAVSKLQLLKGEPKESAEEFLENILCGAVRFGREQEGLSDIQMHTYFALMICSRPVANGKGIHCRNNNFLEIPLSIAGKQINFDTFYLFDCSFSASPPVESIDVKTCWELKSVRSTHRDFEWSLKEPPHGLRLRFSCTSNRDAYQWRMCQVMAKLAHHSEKERGVFLRYLYNQTDQARRALWRPQTAPQSLGGAVNSTSPTTSISDFVAWGGAAWGGTTVGGAPTIRNFSEAPKASQEELSVSSSGRVGAAPSVLPATDCTPSGTGQSVSASPQDWRRVCLITYPGTAVLRRRSTHSQESVADRMLQRFYRRHDGRHRIVSPSAVTARGRRVESRRRACSSSGGCDDGSFD